MQRDLRRPLPYPLVRPLPRHSHVPRGCSKGRSAKVFVLNATRVPPAAWGSPRAFVVNSSTLGFLVWLAGLGRLVLQVFALGYHAIMRRSMPVPTTLRSQGCALATPAADADGFCRLLPDSTSDSSSSFALVRAKQAAPRRRSFSIASATPPTGCALRQVRAVQRASRCGSHIFLPRLVMQNETQPSTKPAATFRYRGISASVFENQSEKGDPYYKVAIVRTYKDGKNGFKSTPTFSRDELPLVIKVAQQAFDFILVTERDNRVERDEK